MIIFTPEQREEFLMLQEGYWKLVDPMPILGGDYGVDEEFIDDPEYAHLHEFLVGLPIQSAQVISYNSASLEQVKAQKLAEINQEADRRLNDLVAAYPAAERSTWPEKIREAESFAGQGSPGVYLPVEAEARGVSVGSLAAKVLEKSHEYHLASAKITGTRGRHTDQVQALGTIEEVQQYDHLAGWD